MNLVFYVYEADFSKLEEFYKASTGEQLAEVLEFLLRDPTYNLKG